MPKTNAQKLAWTQDPSTDQFVRLFPTPVVAQVQQLAFAVAGVDRTILIGPSE